MADSFFLLRWAHLSLFLLSLVGIYSSFDSEIPEKETDAKSTVEEVKFEELRSRHRDSVWKLTSRICDTISVFGYQGTIFFVQMTVFNLNMVCDEGGKCSLAAPKNTIMAWLYIEIYCFYVYMFSTCIYICFHQLVEGICLKKSSHQSDMNKTISDFLDYAQTNLVWFALNTVLIFMPLICMLILNPKSENFDIKGADMSYTYLLATVCGSNLIQFVLRPRISITTKVVSKYEEKVNEAEAPAALGLSGLGAALAAAKKAKQAEEAKNDPANIEKSLIADDESHYIWMEQRFNSGRMWLWIVNLVVYIAVITTYFCMDGHEIIYSMYLPLDVLFNLSKAVYFFAFYFADKREQKKQEDLR